ncbi:MAG: DNA cytosine methyltransferase [Bulleidia sp.]
MRDGLIIDCFAGGGGASTGIEAALGRKVDIAINHDPEAIRMHKVNHPDTLHLMEDIFKTDLKKYVGNRHVMLMWASPDCTQFSKAKGGKPRLSGIRMLPWAVYKHAKAIRPDVVIMENVEEIQQWGPLDDDGHPVKEKTGLEYRKFMSAMKSLGYACETRELIAADFGAPTTRKRWYAIFRSDGQPIVWPEQTHSKTGGLFNMQKWIPCGDLVDWSDLGKSIFDRKKPLAEKTQIRIAKGIRKFIIDNPERYIVNDEKAIAFMIQYHSESKGCDCRGQSLGEPVKTLDTSNRYGLVTAFIDKAYGGNYAGCGSDLNSPINTITTVDHNRLVTAFLTKFYETGTGQSLDDPIHTITTKERFGLVTVEIDGETYAIGDIFLRMLKPEELKVMQGFPAGYVIDRDFEGKPYPKKEQVAKIGNSVVPLMAELLVKNNCRV